MREEEYARCIYMNMRHIRAYYYEEMNIIRIYIWVFCVSYSISYCDDDAISGSASCQYVCVCVYAHVAAIIRSASIIIYEVSFNNRRRRVPYAIGIPQPPHHKHTTHTHTLLWVHLSALWRICGCVWVRVCVCVRARRKLYYMCGFWGGRMSVSPLR